MGTDYSAGMLWCPMLLVWEVIVIAESREWHFATCMFSTLNRPRGLEIFPCPMHCQLTIAPVSLLLTGINPESLEMW
ncbi:hypothetical protein NC651_036499 [Populus alba x Populus x berolinensis]|nr:hypothetical protein NC651_036499 [Populus alba x Populus x berolinensis]